MHVSVPVLPWRGGAMLSLDFTPCEVRVHGKVTGGASPLLANGGSHSMSVTVMLHAQPEGSLAPPSRHAAASTGENEREVSFRAHLVSFERKPADEVRRHCIASLQERGVRVTVSCPAVAGSSSELPSETIGAWGLPQPLPESRARVATPSQLVTAAGLSNGRPFDLNMPLYGTLHSGMVALSLLLLLLAARGWCTADDEGGWCRGGRAGGSERANKWRGRWDRTHPEGRRGGQVSV